MPIAYLAAAEDGALDVRLLRRTWRPVCDALVHDEPLETHALDALQHAQDNPLTYDGMLANRRAVRAVALLPSQARQEVTQHTSRQLPTFVGYLLQALSTICN